MYSIPGEDCCIKVQGHDSADIARLCPSRSITQLAWRRRAKGPAATALNLEGVVEEESQTVFELAVASEDTSIRVYSISDLDVEI